MPRIDPINTAPKILELGGQYVVYRQADERSLYGPIYMPHDTLPDACAFAIHVVQGERQAAAYRMAFDADMSVKHFPPLTPQAAGEVF